MKNNYKYALIALAAFSFAACNDMIESSEPAVDIERTIILTATREGTDPNTRSVRMDDGTTWWSPKEEISVFYGSGANGGSKFTSNNTTLAETTEFEGSISMSGNKEFWAVYPYSAENSCDGSSIVTVIPSQQTGSEGNFSGDAFPAIGKSSSLTMPFWNICGGIKFFVSRADVKSVTFKGNNGEVLAGKVKVAFGADGKPEVAEVIEGQTEVTLTAPDGGAFKAGKYYYMTLLPGLLDGGFTMSFTTASETGTLKSDKQQTIKRSVFGTLKNIDAKVQDWESTVTEPEYIDLGLPSGLKWANMNVGATNPEEYGDYFAWGETEPKSEYNWSTYKWCNGSSSTLTKYNTYSSYGTVDNKTVLDPADDVAHVKWGGSWRMPTFAELQELLDNCTWEWTNNYNGTGVSGCKVTSNMAGYTDKSIFLPAAGLRDGTYLGGAGSWGYYWSSSLNTDRPDTAYYVYFYSDGVYRYVYGRYLGLSVRPVYGEFIPVASISLDETSIELYSGDMQQLTASISPSNATAKDVHWSSSDESIATVDANGLVTSVAPGSATITAFSSNGVNVSCEVTVVSTSIKDFAEEYVKILDIWENTTGSIDMLQGENYSGGSWIVPNAHYVPENTTITVGGKTYNIADMLETAIRSYLFIRGYKGDITDREDLIDNWIPALDGGAMPMSYTRVPKTHGYGWYEHPYNENQLNGGVLVMVDDGSVVHCQVKTDILDNWAIRALRFILGSNDNNIPNMCFYTSEQLTGYYGSFSSRRALITYAFFFKYMLDNGYEIGTQVPDDAIIRSELFGNEQDFSSVQEAIDLGLPSGLKWANMNVGAIAPEDYGEYFAWGETEPKSEYNWLTYKWWNGSSSTLTKYNTDSSYGTVDNKTVLDLEDDAAHVNWGGTWRMPTDAEWTELRTKCTWTWTSQNGVNGRKVTGPNGNSIFLPAAGGRYGSNLNDAGSYDFHWSSSLNTLSPYSACRVYFNSGNVSGSDGDRSYGFSVRPVYGEFVPVTSITLNESSLSLKMGSSAQLVATISPSNATEPSVRWVSADKSIVTVDENGNVTAVAEGTTTVSAYASNGLSSSCEVTVTQAAAEPEAVDLGLSVKWATMNVGATKPEDYGDYFAWGETEPKRSYTWNLYKFMVSGSSSSDIKFNKYNTYSNYGLVDNKVTLERKDDAASVNWGGTWRMATSSEWNELSSECSWEWTEINGVQGYLITSLKEGYTDKSIFLPATGYYNDTIRQNAGTKGYYWTSSLVRGYPYQAYALYYPYHSRYYTYELFRYYGMVVRAVKE